MRGLVLLASYYVFPPVGVFNVLLHFMNVFLSLEIGMCIMVFNGVG